MRLQSNSPNNTIEIGKTLGKHLLPGSVICLTGELGAGKTCFIKGMAEGLGIKRKEVSSPTFIIIREYKGRIPLYHIDLYRIGTLDDIRDIGMEEVIYGNGVTAIEWAERIKDALPDDRIDIKLEWVDDKMRAIEIIAYGEKHRKILEEACKEKVIG
ncbi:MAG: tRNA (adenosine(37)-N6)-threonylcarbamoyltransferase complex ATPase subunit type 1 TsaE [Nitrospirae bacterium]|nr:tRNA (adenosine(37)-N6)-threonylcarbamoyltransferase complex ATPase subunit type 1 TsaE [Nitrospirota bacterium]